MRSRFALILTEPGQLVVLRSARQLRPEAVTAMKEYGVIRDAKSEWASPIALIPKSDGSMRFCVDYRRLNELTVRNSYPLPRMEDCLDSLREAAFFKMLDCN